MFVVLLVFIAFAAATLRSTYVYDRAEARNAPAKVLNHLTNVGATYMVVTILAGFTIVGTVEAGL